MIRTVNRERITGGLTSMIREHKKQQQQQQHQQVRRDRLLGIPSSVASPSSTTHELLEEDVWGPSISTIPGFQESHVVAVDSSILSKWRSSRAQPPSDCRMSVPINVPDWAKILKRNQSSDFENAEDDEDKENWEVENMPPHKLVELADEERSIRLGMAFSVVEGAGRTLKGWDLRRVRDAVWIQTGFIACS